MDTELTGRKVKIPAELRTFAEEGMARIEKIVGKGATAHIIFSAEKHLQCVEVTVNAKHHTVVGQSEAPDMKVALRTAIEKAEKQALRWKKTQVEKKRKGSTIKEIPAEGAAQESPAAASPRTVNGKSIPAKAPGLHIVRTPEAMAARPMSIEEAVKEAEAGDREVFVFRDHLGDVKVLHCAGDGIVRLIEVS